MTSTRNDGMSRARSTVLALTVFLIAHAALAQPGELLLPDLIVREADLHEHDFVTDDESRTLLRLNNGTANVGPGMFYIYGVPPDGPSEEQVVVQRIFDAEFRFEDFVAGSFIYHPEHKHIHVEDWNVYRVRELLPDGGVGPIVAEGEKISVCIIDVAVHDRDLPNFVEFPRFISCGSQDQGLSVGWADIYTRNLPGQSIDVTDLADGIYWLESEVDPDENFIETDDSNNVARIQITIGDPPAAPDAFEPNDAPGDPEFFRPGAPWSSNLGPCDPVRTVEPATIHVPEDEDHYRFYINTAGDEQSEVRLEYAQGAGELTLSLLSAAGAEIARAEAIDGVARIGLEERVEGWYTARVFATTPPDEEVSYTLTVKPPANAPPAIELLDPPDGGETLIHGFDLYAVRWAFEDADNDLAWVTLYLNEEPVLDGTEILLMTSLNTDATTGVAVINTAELEPGTYWVYASITDGGTTTGAWSRGAVTLVEIDEECASGGLGDLDDCNANGVLDACEIEVLLVADCDGNGIPDPCDLRGDPARDADADGINDDCQRVPFRRGDVNDDGEVGLSDAVAVFNALFLGTITLHCLEAADVDNDSVLNISDGIGILDYLFRGALGPAPPGPSPGCGHDPDPRGSAADLGCASFESCPQQGE